MVSIHPNPMLLPVINNKTLKSKIRNPQTQKIPDLILAVKDAMNF